jgi:acetyltransferase-like isoleucine patch superfamily enzyme
MDKLKNNFKKIIIKFKNPGKRVKLLKGCILGINTHFEGLNKIGYNTIFEGSLGYGSYIGDNCVISAIIGRYCSIASNVKVLTGTHPIEGFVSTHPVFYSLGKQNGASYTDVQRFDEKLYADKNRKLGIIVGNDVWIGYGATIIGAVKIGDGAVILANAMVTKDIAPYSIVGGVPAREISKRFDYETIQELMQFKWWDMDEKWLRENIVVFSDIEKFKALIT